MSRCYLFIIIMALSGTLRRQQGSARYCVASFHELLAYDLKLCSGTIVPYGPEIVWVIVSALAGVELFFSQ